MGKVLLTDGLLRKTLAAVRSLGSKGIETVVSEKTRCNPAFFSKYCSSTRVYPDPVADADGFRQCLLETLQKEKVDVLFPMDDAVMDIVLEHREQLSNYCKLPLPPTESYRICVDKGEAVQLADRSGVHTPKTYFPERLEDVEDLLEKFSYPMVIKPRRSSGSRGIRIVHDEQELMSQYREISEAYPNPILQEYIKPGIRYDVCLIFNQESQLRGMFVQKEVRHYPIDIGPSTVQESVKYPELVEMSLAMMKHLPWYGVVEFEFMINPRTGQPTFMEINPRFWNSLHLAILAGVDFPWMQVNHALIRSIDTL